MPEPMTTPLTAPSDPADFITELHADGILPQNSGGDPAVPDSAFPDTHVYQQPGV
ncbi:hypothetical protein [Streptomyces sp. NBC_01716]|uniref:hypothetical protein n=1 Tax=Streptomyces sp. NBC_01716 TaxID=2975917 RepID=UPI002E360689|nr:hypothetical protein [Streptomyces sp. NBC_01716]